MSDRDEELGDDRAEAEERDDDQGEEDEESPPKITLDRYLSQRRPPPRAGLPHLAAAVVMLITLVLILMYKDRCGSAVSNVMGEMDPPESTSGSTIPARIELQPSEKKGPETKGLETE